MIVATNFLNRATPRGYSRVRPVNLLGTDDDQQHQMGYTSDPNQLAMIDPAMRLQAAQAGLSRAREQSAGINFGVFQEQNRNKLAQQQLAADQQTEAGRLGLQRDEASAKNSLARGHLGLQARVADVNARIDQGRLGLAQQQFQLDDWNTRRQPTALDIGDQRYMAEGVGNLEEQARAHLAELRQMDLTPEGRKAYAEMAGTFGAIAKQRGSMRPEQYNAMLGQWVESAGMRDIGTMVNKPKTLQEMMSGNFMDLGNGRAVIRNGDKISVEQIGDDPAVANGKKSPADMPYAEYRNQVMGVGPDREKNYDKLYSAAMDDLKNDYLAKNPDSVATPKFSPADVQARIEEQLKARHQFFGGQPDPPSMNPMDRLRSKEEFQTGGQMPVWPPLADQLSEDDIESPSDRPGRAGVAPDLMRRSKQASPANPQANTRQPAPEIVKMMSERPDDGRVANLRDSLAQAGLGDIQVESVITPSAIKLLQEFGSKDPIGDAAESVVHSMKTGGRHYSLLSTMEQKMIRELGVQVVKSDAEIDALPNGTLYMDAGLEIFTKQEKLPKSRQELGKWSTYLP